MTRRSLIIAALAFAAASGLPYRTPAQKKPEPPRRPAGQTVQTPVDTSAARKGEPLPNLELPEYDITGSDLVCLQCGYVQSVAMREPAAEDGRDMTVAAGASPSLSEMAA